MRMLKICTLCAVLTLSGCGYNSIVRLDEAVSVNNAQVQSVYQKRADLIPNIVEVVKAEASFEKSTLEAVITARAKATQVTLPENATPEEVKTFMDAQKAVGTGLGRLLAVFENYPTLRSNDAFKDLRRQLEEIEAQAGAARNRYIRSIRDYNVAVRNLWNRPGVMLSGAKLKPQITFEEDSQKLPQVKL